VIRCIYANNVPFMKIVQSFWTNAGDADQIRAGYPDLKSLLMSWSLSCLQLKKFYPDVELVTDNLGKELLIDRLKLPYDVVHLNLEEFRTPFPSLWTLKKLYAYTLFRTPFLHVDGDVFIWKAFPKSLLESDLVAQNVDLNLSFYRKSLSEISGHFKYIPSYLNPNTGVIVCANAGIIGGANYQFFAHFYEEVYNFLNRNETELSMVNSRNLSTVLEQHFYNLLACQAGIKISYLFPDFVTETNYLNFHGFTNLPLHCDYIHLMEGKSNYSLCEQMAQRLLLENPTFYQNVLDVIEDLKETAISQGNKQRNHEKESSSILYLYNRTLEMLNCAYVNTVDITNIAQLKNSIAQLGLKDRAKEVLEDAFFYENEKRKFSEFIHSSEGLFHQYAVDSSNLNEFLANFDITAAKIKVSNVAKFIESKWNWCERNEFCQNPIDYAVNLHSDPFFFKTALFVYFNPLVIKEYTLDPLSVIIFDIIEEMDDGLVVQELTKLVMCILKDSNVVGDEQTIVQSIHEHIKFFLYQHLLILIE
jgi:hypothetical protein